MINRFLSRQPIMILAVTLGAFTLRMYGNDDLSLWLDEAYSLWFAQQSLYDLWTEIPHFETQPPFYYTILKSWLIFGTSEGALRSLSAVVGAITVPVVYWIGVNVGGEHDRRSVGIIAALVVALSPVLIQYGQEARPYAALVLAYALALAGLSHLIRFPDDACRPWLGVAAHINEPYRPTGPISAVIAWSALTLGTAAMLWLHYTAIIYVAPLFISLFLCSVRKSHNKTHLLLNILIIIAVVILLCIPLFYFLSLQFHKVISDYWIPDLTSRKVLQSLWYLFGLHAPIRLKLIPNFILAFIAVAGLVRLVKSERRSFAFMLTMAMTLPIALLVGLSEIIRPIFLNRLLIGVTIPYAVAIAICVTWLTRGGLRASAVALLTALFFLSAVNYFQLRQKEPWRDIVAYVADRVGQNDVVLILGGNTALPFTYYAKERPAPMPLKIIPEPYPAGGRGVVPFTTEHLSELIATVDKHDQVWLVTRREDLMDPHDLVRHTIEEGREVILHRNFGYTINVWLYR